MNSLLKRIREELSYYHLHRDWPRYVKGDLHSSRDLMIRSWRYIGIDNDHLEEVLCVCLIAEEHSEPNIKIMDNSIMIEL